MNLHLLALSRSKALTPRLLRGLHELCGSWAAIWDFDPKNLDAYCRHHRHQGFEGREALLRSAEEVLAQCRKHAIAVLTAGDEGYPARLAEIYDLPLALYLAGALPPQSFDTARRNVAIVGTRHPLPDLENFSRRCASLLASCGFHVISGLALGIDGAAHAGALDGGGPTTAAVAGGPEVIYPTAHRGLHRRILENGGAIVSEYPPGTRPLAFHFPERNRIISGLCDAVLMVQAGERSGALITVKTALDQNRDVLTVDRGDRGPATLGNRRLIEQGAHAIREPEDLLSWFQAPCAPSRPDPQLRLGGDEGAALRRQVLESLGGRPQHLGELAEKLGCAIEPLAAQVSALLLCGFVNELPGDRFGLA